MPGLRGVPEKLAVPARRARAGRRNPFMAGHVRGMLMNLSPNPRSGQGGSRVATMNLPLEPLTAPVRSASEPSIPTSTATDRRGDVDAKQTLVACLLQEFGCE